MMFPLFLPILLGLPWVDTTINNTSGFDNSTSGLDNAFERRSKWSPTMRCHSCQNTNSFSCPTINDCHRDKRRCLTVALRVNLRKLFVYKTCTTDCTFVYRQHVPGELPRMLKNVKNFYFVLCCGSVVCNEGGPSNIERDLLTETSIEEEEIARAVGLGRVNLLLCLTLILSSSILT
ncbi:glycosyl-phosphatidylinositol-anchored molecule-like protein [Mastomys coucha]|uniref:glycosyl-phosphatidylinositol-anchored molecule-like protein n=1 Tax=Mastomys coucha TaxID=35658 RepID=UPI00126205D5|nr:glycosyl-phosphatidylinositol-anchored molecule-like protein [Mastomys coucha]XP_031202077.1 glycosyl-phosphatidylinositol-anchored molecule-like protein [Mastomys coucha]XP_031202087.1 glycosyl-phosphatidylinositol-anchored molecule-like protein [Mastomys coucha]XP_031202096.1 glycosyl-phosphatidylinositol-anchored molecule-like protein [Mastomys coucha]